MFVIGVTGPIGSGKTTVCSCFMECGIVVLDADAMSREVTEQGGCALNEIRSLLDDRVFDAEGRLDRKAVATIVFSDRKLLDELSSIIHRNVLDRMADRLEEEKMKGTKVVVMDVPIPVKTGFVDRCNQIWVVDASETRRLLRLEKRGMDRADAKRRMAMQMTSDEYRELADIVIENDMDIGTLKATTMTLIEQELSKRGIRV